MGPKQDITSSSDSDDENDEQMRQFLEAADTTLLTNDMYQKPSQKDTCINEKGEQKVLKTNRYLLEEDIKADVDFITTDAVKEHIAKKLTQIIASHIEFCDVVTTPPSTVQKMSRNRVKLLTGASSYVKPYEEFEFETKGPSTKPIIKRRNVDGQEEEVKHEDLCRLVSVTSEDILTGKLTVGWVQKRERNKKIYQYKRDSMGNLHLKPTENEFTKLRHKNQWNESKIKQSRSITSK